jgi:hypothetical protein
MSIDKRIVCILLDDEECLLHLEVLSCEKQINELVEYLSHKYCMKEIFISEKVNK